MQDSLEFIKKMWGGMGVPGMVVPTLSVEEINKKISDLKAVESWLNLNLNMLRTTIQALEVQSGTISALQAMAAVNQASTERQGDSDAESNASAWASAAGFPFSGKARAAAIPAWRSPDRVRAAASWTSESASITRSPSTTYAALAASACASASA